MYVFTYMYQHTCRRNDVHTNTRILLRHATDTYTCTLTASMENKAHRDISSRASCHTVNSVNPMVSKTCEYVYMYVCMYTCMHTCMYTCMYACMIYVCTYLIRYVYVKCMCMNVCYAMHGVDDMHACVHVSM